MDSVRFDDLLRSFALGLSRRATLGAALGSLVATGSLALLADDAEAKKKRKKRKKKRNKCKGCCLASGSVCTKASAKCKASHCLSAPLTIEAHWTTADADHDTYLFVPNEAGEALPAPFIDFDCEAFQSDCESDRYPFTCANGDAFGPGDEVITVRRLIAGRYEYWVELAFESPAADLTVTLRRPNDSVVRSWSSPPNPDNVELGWHVFNLDGASGSIVSIDQISAGSVPEGAHDPSTDVCPQA